MPWASCKLWDRVSVVLYHPARYHVACCMKALAQDRRFAPCTVSFDGRKNFYCLDTDFLKV